MLITDQVEDELASLFLERPIMATELGLMAEEDFVSLTRSIFRRLRKHSLMTLAGIDKKKRPYQDILETAQRARAQAY